MNDFRMMCIREGFFTSGCNNQYIEVITYFNMAVETFKEFGAYEDLCHDLEAVVYMTWICSDTDIFSVVHVRHSVQKLFEEVTGYEI